MRIIAIFVKLLPNQLKVEILRIVNQNQNYSASNFRFRFEQNFLIRILSKITRIFLLENKRMKEDFESELINLISPNIKTKHKKIKIIYDNRISPPTYGDLFHVIMLARLLNLMKLEVCFVLYQGKNRNDWGYLDKRAITKFEKEQKELIEKLFRGDLIVKKNWYKYNIDKRIIKSNRDYLVISGYFIVLDLIKKITSAHLQHIPSDFYLTNHEFPINKVSPYICMNVRKGIWSQGRDTNEKLIVDDYITLRKEFPAYKIQILANEVALKHFYKIMKESHIINSVEPDWRKQILVQTKFSFIEALELVLSSNFYYQRPNGGMVVVALYSKIPYFSMTEGYHSFDVDRNKHFPFSSTSQVFIDSNLEWEFNKNLSTLFKKYQFNLD
jgi:hypothetical protein